MLNFVNGRFTGTASIRPVCSSLKRAMIAAGAGPQKLNLIVVMMSCDSSCCTTPANVVPYPL